MVSESALNVGRFARDVKGDQASARAAASVSIYPASASRASEPDINPPTTSRKRQHHHPEHPPLAGAVIGVVGMCHVLRRTARLGVGEKPF
ncbi:MAG: hypothetical protein VX741_13320 [Pseudomonadota bacterium]|nr:hypothetical protein [Pseudomonadota bacterium]